MPITVRATDRDDWQRLRRLRLEALADTPMAFGQTTEHALAMSEGDWRAYAGRGKDPNRTFIVAIDEASGEFVGMMGGGLKHWQRFAIFGTSSILLPGLALVLARYAIGAFHGPFLLVWAIGAATSFAVGCVLNGLAYFTGRFVTAWALVIFVFANIPSSGGAYPPEFVPQPFRWLHDVVSGTGTVNLMRHAVYGVGPAPWRGWLLLACYAVVGVAVAAVGKPFARWKSDRRKAAGRPPSMMTVVQATSLIHGGYVRPLASVDDVATGDDDAATERALDALPRCEEPEPEVSAEEADGDAIAAETGVVP